LILVCPPSSQTDSYKTAGIFEARYFYGDDPTIPGAFGWMGQGYTCNTYIAGTYTPGGGWEGNPKIGYLKLEQCQCDPTLASQTLTFVDGSPNEVVIREVCQSYAAACSRCFLDAAATSSTVSVVASLGNEGAGRHMEHIPGFEIALQRL